LVRPDAVAPDGSDIFFRVLDADRASLVEVELAPGGVSRPVSHRTVEEIWYFLSGSGSVWLRAPDGSDEETRSVGPGDTLVIRTGWTFQLQTLGAVPLRFLCFTSPPWPGDDEAVPAKRGGIGKPTV
jgi:mannose-6-phosphate isomerase-like protein (cupin superfamily)